MIKANFKLKYFKYFEKHLTFPSSWTSLFVIDSYYAHIIHHNRIKHVVCFACNISDNVAERPNANFKLKAQKYDIIVKMHLHCLVQMKGSRT